VSASFEEKSSWIQLGALVLVMGGYLATAWEMMSAGVLELAVYVPVFVPAVVALVIVLIAGHAVAALFGSTDDADERDRLIGWRAEARSSWLMGLGVLAAITAMIVRVEPVYVAHGLFASLLLSDVLGHVLRLIDYRRGLPPR